MDTREPWRQHVELRQSVYNRFHDEWGLGSLFIDYSDDVVVHLSWLCGRGPENKFDLGAECTPEEVRFCEALLGPHGYAVYRARVAQLEGSQNDQDN